MPARPAKCNTAPPAVRRPASSPRRRSVRRPVTPPAPPLILTTSSFQDGGVIPDKYTQASATTAVSPALNWTNVPAGTMSFTLIMHDVDNASRKGIADIIITKQRNGPTGEVNLTFLGEFTKFENLVAESYGEGVWTSHSG